MRHRCTIDYIQPRGIRFYIGFFFFILTHYNNIILYYTITDFLYTVNIKLLLLYDAYASIFSRRTYEMFCQTRFRNKIHDVCVARILRSVRKIVKFLSKTHIKYVFSPSY